MIYATADLHGYPHGDFMKLLGMVNFNASDTLYVLGDVIDRNGDGGIETLEWLLNQPNARMLLGNHEAMLLACAFMFRDAKLPSVKSLKPGKRALLREWMTHGGRPTLDNLAVLRREHPDRFYALMGYLQTLPLYETVSVGGRDFLLVHSGLGNFDPDKPLDAYTPDELLNHRPTRKEQYLDEALTILGHTPTTKLHGVSGRMLRMPTWIDIDTGAGKGGAPMLLRLNDLNPYYIK